jgi:nitroreductase
VPENDDARRFIPRARPAGLFSACAYSTNESRGAGSPTHLYEIAGDRLMDFLQVVQQRRAVREYRDVPVDPALIERLVGVAVRAPSAMNLQPWAFAVITGIERIDEYARRAKAHLLTQANPANARASELLSDPNFSIFYHAPALVLVLARSDEGQAKEDCCLAAQIFMLAAREAGLGTCWIGLGRPWLDLAETKIELGLPRDYHVVAPIVLGFPRAWPPLHERNPPEIHWVDRPSDRSKRAEQIDDVGVSGDVA